MDVHKQKFWLYLEQPNMQGEASLCVYYDFYASIECLKLGRFQNKKKCKALCVRLK